LYVASPIGEKERARGIQNRLRSLGHEITLEWTDFPSVPVAERNTRRECEAKEYSDFLSAKGAVTYQPSLKG
jgi:hypothetical protein